MKVCILGWYGTETIGDRAILVGIYSFLSKVFKDFDINLGSLHPFYSKRMVSEDKPLYRELLSKDIDIRIFDSTNIDELNINIRNSDFIIMGGGPIMHIDELYLIEYAFKKAKKLGKKTGIIGCGIGPLFVEKYKKAAINLINYSDLVILRDEKSKENLKKICRELNGKIDFEKVYTSLDPAVECAIRYNAVEKNTKKDSDIVINLREFPMEYSTVNNKENIDRILEKFIIEISERYKENDIVLVPMHYFYIGNDDRKFLNEIKIKNDLNNVYVQNSPMSLKDTMCKFRSAKFNVGMRFHSVVLQTILSGKNYVIDYTEPNIGKISGFLNSIDKQEFYKDKYLNLQKSNTIYVDKFNELDKQFLWNEDFVENELDIYVKKIRGIYCEE